MSLLDVIDNNRTDKNTAHSYIDIYENLFNKKKNDKVNILEIGIFYTAGSVKLWNDYFINGNIYAVDVMKLSDIQYDDVKNMERVTLLTEKDAYNDDFINYIKSLNIKFDIIIDDGPHSLDSQCIFMKKYSQFLTDDGILVCEDIQSIDHVDILKSAVPENLKQYIKVFDIRNQKGRWDDILVVIDKLNF